MIHRVLIAWDPDPRCPLEGEARVCWAADRRARVTVPYPSGIIGLFQYPDHVMITGDIAAKVTRFLAADPLNGVEIRYADPLVTITLADGQTWTPRRVRAANLELAHLGAGLTLRYRPASRDTPTDVGLVVDGSFVVDWWGEARSRSVIVGRRAV